MHLSIETLFICIYISIEINLKWKVTKGGEYNSNAYLNVSKWITHPNFRSIKLIDRSMFRPDLLERDYFQ